MKKIIPLLLLLICFGGAGYATYGILSEQAEVRQAEQASALFDEYSPFNAQTLAPKQDGGTDYAALHSGFLQDLEQLRARNSDVMGWLYIPETHINYPLLLGSDNKWYLTHAADGSRSAAGSVFVDSSGFGGANTIIYGHNMGRSSDVIFHDITNFSDRAWFDKVPQAYIITEAELIRLDIFAYALTRSETPFYADPPDIDYIRKNAMYFREPEAADRLFTLSTCAYDYKNARALLISNGVTVYSAKEAQ